MALSLAFSARIPTNINIVSTDLGNVMPIEDPSVLSRQRLKAISSRIVEQNSKKDEFEKKKK